MPVIFILFFTFLYLLSVHSISAADAFVTKKALFYAFTYLIYNFLGANFVPYDKKLSKCGDYLSLHSTF